MDLCMVPIGRYISHRIRHTILIVTSSHTVVPVASLYQVIHTNITPSHYRTINSITQLYVYAWNNCVVIIIWWDKRWTRTMDTDVTTDSTRRLTIYHHRPTCQPIPLYVPTQSYITIKYVASQFIYHNWYDSIQPSTVIHSRRRRPPPSPDTKVPSYHRNNNWWHRRWHRWWQLTPYNIVIIYLLCIRICSCTRIRFYLFSYIVYLITKKENQQNVKGKDCVLSQP